MKRKVRANGVGRKGEREKNGAVAGLDGARERIDSLDNEILDLLAVRADVAREIAELKRAAKLAVFHDPERERRVLDRLVDKGGERFPPDAIRAVFREVMSACLSVEQPLRVAYLGPEGTFTQMAARRLFGLQARYRECATIDAVFEAIDSGDATYGVVPFENSTEGSVSMTSDALLEGDLVIRQELVVPIAHCLLSRAGSLSRVQTVYSHPQALAQCRAWLAKHLPRAQVVQTTSTAAAAREAKADERAAAIAADIAGELYSLPIVRANIQDRAENATRFVVLGKTDAPPTGEDRTTIAFGVLDAKGALRRVLSVLEDAGVNLTRIESRPDRARPWQYVFLVDLEGHRSEPALARAIAAVAKTTAFVKVLGSYPRAPVDPTRARAPSAKESAKERAPSAKERAPSAKERERKSTASARTATRPKPRAAARTKGALSNRS